MSSGPVSPTFLAVNKLAKWRSVFAAWQLGTRKDTDGECRALKDHREVTILLRAEMNAFLGLMLRKGIITEAEWDAALEREAKQLDKDYEAKFPGYSTTQAGVSMDLKRAGATMQRLGFPE